MPLELYGTRSCPYTGELREDLEWKGDTFVEYDVDEDASALQRMLALTDGNRTVPVLVEDGRIKQIGVNGRGCYVNGP
ncbi:MAG: glutaredoxin family protein [Candidatus Eremiobacteraeota bacterium]|nr:glutaredoxin family protein [Candidatus Eremiobacteraeota bacterium]